MPKFQYQPKRGGFRHLLRRIVKTTAIDWFRHRESMQLSNDVVEQTATPHHDDLALSEQRSALHRALKVARRKSTTLAWTCFEQHVIDRQSAREVGQQLGLSANAVYVSASRVLDRVRTLCIEMEKGAQHE